MIKVSVIVPVYKVPLEYLRECLDSLLAQTMQECEFVVVSDGAPEAERSVCEQYAGKDLRFKFFHREHAGVSATRNYGIEQSRGEYITFVDSDDWIEFDTLDEAYLFANNNNNDLVFWNFSLNEEKKKLIKNICFARGSNRSLNKPEKDDFAKSIIWPGTEKKQIPAVTVCKLIHRSIINKGVKFDKELIIGEDRVFNYSISKLVDKVGYLDRCFYHYRQSKTSAIHSYKKHFFNHYLAYINKLNQLRLNKFERDIANETLYCFYGCIFKIYESNLSYQEKKEELLYLKNQIKKRNFTNLIQSADTQLNSFIFSLEIFLMKRKISWLFSLRILKFKINHLTHSFFPT